MSAAPSIPESTATVEAAQAGLLYERYSGKILGYCRRRLSSREEAEDAVQHTFLNAYRSLRTGVVPHAEAAWLYKIAENVCHERRRSAWRRSRIELVWTTARCAMPRHLRTSTMSWRAWPTRSPS
jgi:DNA-directed RNA polymerase specialized sigma24 family protein